MTNTDKSHNAEASMLSEVEQVTYNELGAKTLTALFSYGKKIECVLWTFPNGVETAIARKKVKIDAQQFSYKNKLYNIDHSRVQNRMGKLVYNVHVNNSVGALSFVKPQTSRDAKNAEEMLQRNWLTALWSINKMPLIIALIACVVAIAMVILFFVILGQSAGKDQVILNLTVENTNLKAILYPPQPQPELVNPPN